MQWPGQEPPSCLPNFESLARKHRFRLLGKACKDLKINSLLLAHHDDDQAETILMRLANGQGAKGLLGIKNPANIPECYGIYGVYESGGECDAPGESLVQQKMSMACSSSHSKTFIGRQLPIESGGVQVYRPFLSFSKDQLIATCVAESMPWFEDHTNTEPTLTMRNAVRHMFIKHSMPAALAKPALLALSKKLNDRAAQRSDIIKSWLAKCEIVRFETRTGTLKVRFANLNQFRRSREVWPPLDAGLIAAELLRQIVLLVTPREHVDLRALHNAVHHIFPEISQQNEQNFQTSAFTASGVYFQPIQAAHSQKQSPTFMKKKPEWSLSRQPYTSGSLPEVQLHVAANDRSWWSPWQLYDGRFWIRVQNPSSLLLSIKPFQCDHLADFRASIAWPYRIELREVLRDIAPGNVRWTLPAIVRKEKNGKEKLIALPSLDICISKCMVRWDIRYKKVCKGIFGNADL
jgi:tRNA(Ile)-lysidine synthase